MNLLRAAGGVPLAQADVAPTGAGAPAPGYATDGDPVQQIPPTDWPAYIFNALLQEIVVNTIQRAGLTPSDVDCTQLGQAICILPPGRLLNPFQAPYVGSGLILPVQGASFYDFKCQAPGGAGGWAETTGSGQCSAGGGGQGGSFAWFRLTAAQFNGLIAAGAAGVAYTAGNGGQPGGSASPGGAGDTLTLAGVLSCLGGAGGQIGNTSNGQSTTGPGQATTSPVLLTGSLPGWQAGQLKALLAGKPGQPGIPNVAGSLGGAGGDSHLLGTAGGWEDGSVSRSGGFASGSGAGGGGGSNNAGLGAIAGGQGAAGCILMEAWS